MGSGSAHWFSPVRACAECGEPADHADHLRRCQWIAMSRRPGSGFCRLAESHDGDHELVWWDGEVTRGDETIEPGKPFELPRG